LIAVKKKYSYPFTLFILTFLPIFRSLSEPIYTEEMLINEAANTPKKLHIYNWADYINPDALLNFEREFGIDREEWLRYRYSRRIKCVKTGADWNSS
jgi:spermidine/putrescine-binding protein